VTNEIRRLLLGHSSVDRIRGQATTQGVRPLREDGRLKVFEGFTTVEEVLRVTAWQGASPPLAGYSTARRALVP
jgi:general secretion pathway protein E